MVDADDHGSITGGPLRTLRLSSSGEDSSNLIDPIQLTDLLHKASAESRLSQRRPQAIERSPTPPGRSSEDYESEAYHDLIREGGQPLYAISLIGHISKDPEQYRDLLRPWLKCPTSDSPPNWTEIFKTQLERWRDFGKWQLDNRDLPDKNDDYPTFVDVAKRRYDRDRALDLLDRLSADPEMLKPEWEERRRLREVQRRTIREIRGDHSFFQYSEAVKCRLRKHGFSRTFQLQEDPTQQDPSTTWVEYLGFECWWFDRYTSLVAARCSKSTDAWNSLVASGVLGPSDTPESVRSDASALARARERGHAEKDIASAKLAAEHALMLTRTAMRNPAVATVSEGKRKTLLASAHERLEAAERYLRTIQNRNKLITDFVQQSWDYDEARRNAARQKDLLQWVLERMPAIGADMTQGINQRTIEMLQCNRGHDPVDYRESKRRRTDRSTKPPVQRLLANQAQTLKTSKSERRATDYETTETASTPLRRSARIAAMQHQTNSVATPLGPDRNFVQKTETRNGNQPRSRSKRKLGEI